MMNLSCQELIHQFSSYIKEGRGDLNRKVQFISPIEKPESGGLIYVLKPTFLKKAIESDAQVILITPKMADAPEVQASQKTFLLSDVPELTAAKISEKFFSRDPRKQPRKQNISPRAVIDETARLEEGVIVEANAVIGANVVIKKNTYIGHSSVIEDGVLIGEACTIHPLVFIGYNCKIGNHCEIHSNATLGTEGFGYAHNEKGEHFRIPQTGIVVLHDQVDVGANTVIDRATFGETVIGEGSKLDNICHIAHNCKVGRFNFITSGFKMAGSSSSGDFCVFGGNTCITDHVNITNQVHLAGLSAVTKDIEKPGAYGGYPLQSMTDFLKTTATLVHLPQMRKDISKLLKATGVESSEKQE